VKLRHKPAGKSILPKLRNFDGLVGQARDIAKSVVYVETSKLRRVSRKFRMYFVAYKGRSTLNDVACASKFRRFYGLPAHELRALETEAQAYDDDPGDLWGVDPIPHRKAPEAKASWELGV